MTSEAWIELAKYFGLPIAMFVYALHAGYKQKWHWDHELKDMTADRNFWRNLALRQANLLEKAVGDRDGRP